jgi:hypothetical protein
VAERLPTWRARLDQVGRSLESAECWSGSAAQSAAHAVLDLSAVTWAVDTALDRSTAAYESLGAEATAAQELATEALAVAETLPVDLDPSLQALERLGQTMRALVPQALAPAAAPALALADEALRHGAAAAAAATEAGTALAGLAVRDAFGPADFSDLLARVPLTVPVGTSEVPAGRGPEEVAAWWAGLPAGAQLAAIRTAPAAVGGLDGIPAWARDRANRLVLAQVLHDPRTPPYAAFTAGVVSRRVAAEEAAGRQVQLQLLDLGGDRVVLALGDLDSADAVALVVPGIFTSPADDLDGLTRTARSVAVAARAAAPDVAVATAVWLGYRTPSTVPAIVTRAAAGRGGAALAAALDGLRAARSATGSPPPRTTVLAHSYGTVVVDEAADAEGFLAADAVVLLGSPGMEQDAQSLEVPEVYDAASPRDPISWLGWFGGGTWSERYGSTGLPGEASMGHSDYYQPDHPTLAAIGEVVAGVRTPD